MSAEQHPEFVRMLRDSREGNPSRGEPIRTVVAAGDVLPCLRIVRSADLVASQRGRFPDSYLVRFPDGTQRAVEMTEAEPVDQ